MWHIRSCQQAHCYYCITIKALYNQVVYFIELKTEIIHAHQWYIF